MTFSRASGRVLDLPGIDWPIVQAPMAGTSTPEMAAAVSNAGGLGPLGVGAMTDKAAGEAITAFRARSPRRETGRNAGRRARSLRMFRAMRRP